MNDPVYINEIFSSIQGEGMLAGRRQIFVRMAGCNLECRYCDTDFEITDTCHVESKPGSGMFLDSSQPMSLGAVTTVITNWLAQLPGVHHSVSITGGEPLLYADSLAEWLPVIRTFLPIQLETNGTLYNELRQVKRYLDFISMDMKIPSTAGCCEILVDEHTRFLQEACESNISIKVVVGELTSDSEMWQVSEIISSIDASLPLFLQPVTLPDGCIGISAGHTFHLQELALSRLRDVRVIPQMHKMLGVF